MEEEDTPKTDDTTPTNVEIAQLAGLASSMRAMLLLCAPQFAAGSEGEAIMRAAAQAQPLIAKCAKIKPED